MTIQTALENAIKTLVNSPSARLDAQILLTTVLGVDKAYLFAYGERELTEAQAAKYQTLIERRSTGEPIAYIIGQVGFYDIELMVSPAVLIPRPETEHLIEAALEFSKNRTGLVAADIGTGSGAIAVTFAKHCPQAEVHAVDISAAALAIARQNAEKIGVAIQFYEGHLAQPLVERGLKIDLLMANLPYIPTAELVQLEVSKHEPLLALDGGEDGLDLVRELLQQAKAVCSEKALILLEIGSGQGQECLEIAQDILAPREASLIYDYAGHDRIVRILV